MARVLTGWLLAGIGVAVCTAAGVLLVWSTLPSSSPARLMPDTIALAEGRAVTLHLVVNDAQMPLAIRVRGLAPGVDAAQLSMSMSNRQRIAPVAIGPGDPATGLPSTEASFAIGRLAAGSHDVRLSAQGADVAGQVWAAWTSHPSWPATVLTWLLLIGVPVWMAVFLVDMWLAASPGGGRVRWRSDD